MKKVPTISTKKVVKKSKNIRQITPSTEKVAINSESSRIANVFIFGDKPQFSIW